MPAGGHNKKPLVAGVDPLVRSLFEEMERRKITAVLLSQWSGIGRSSIENWRKGNSPSIHLLRAAWNALGYQLSLVEIKPFKKGI